MKVERLTLRNFRNIKECVFLPDSKINFLIGANGQGKTSFLEALSYLATLRSFRGAKNEEVVRWGETLGEVSCLISPDEPPDDPALGWQAELKVIFQKTGASSDSKTSKVAFINGKPFKSSTQYLSHRFGNFEMGFHTVVFNPADHDLVRGDPATRRSYLDRVLSAEEIDYLKILQKYQRALDQRNALLKSDPPPSPELLRGFTEPLSHYGAMLTLARLQWLARLAGRLDNTARQIAPSQAPLKAVYLSNWAPKVQNLSKNNNKLDSIHFTGQDALPSLELLEQAFWTHLSVVEQAELRTRTSLVGPHRDDWTFFLGDRVLKGHGSQGEVRSALLALKLSEIALFQERTGHRPLLLLDDFSSELDQDRREFLLRFLKETGLQVFVTTTEVTSHSGTHFKVSNGCLERLGQGHREEGVYGNRTE